MAKSTAPKTCLLIGILFVALTSPSWGEEEWPDFLHKLNSHYGESFTVLDHNRIQWSDGEISLLDDGIKKTLPGMIGSADIQDQFSMAYPAGPMSVPPLSESDDPGRVRNDQFFKKLYGSSPQEVEASLRELEWMPNHTDTTLLFNTNHGAWDSLQKVSQELDGLDEELLKYVTVTAGTYYWRVIKDTDRLSAHSFGIAIDINVQYSSYWKWDKVYEYKNAIPYEIIWIFEKNGFIWGGKWYHYDTMHFEYRPELF